MRASREDFGKIIIAFGVLFLIITVSFDFFYFAVILATLYFFYTLYKSRDRFSNDIILVVFLAIYVFFLTFFVIFISFLAGMPQAYRGAMAVAVLLCGLYISGYFEKIKR